MANYTVSDDALFDGDYSAAGAGYYEWASGDIFTYYSGGSRQVYTKNGDTDRKLFYCKHFLGNDKWGWILGTPDSGVVEDFYEETADVTPYVGSWVDVGGYITLSEAGAVEVSASNDIEFDSDTDREGTFGRDAENDIEFEAEADTEQQVFGENDAEFSQDADAHREISVSASTDIEFSQDNYLTYNVEANTDIEFDQENERLRIIYRDGEGAIEFDEAITQVRFGENGIELSHIAEAYATKPVDSGVEFSDSAIREPMEFNRAASTGIEFNDAGAAYNESDPSHGICDDEYVCDRDHITLSCTDPVTTIDLRNPSDDSLKVILNIINRYSRGEELRETGVHPRFLQLHYQFTSMPASQKAAFIAFYKATAGLEITLIDFCGQEWIGCIIDKEINFNREAGRTNTDPSCPEPDDGLYGWEFTFEGERTINIYRSWGTLEDTYEVAGNAYLRYNIGLDIDELIEGGSRKYYRGVTHPHNLLIWYDSVGEGDNGWLIVDEDDDFQWLYWQGTTEDLNPPTMVFINVGYNTILSVNDETVYHLVRYDVYNCTFVGTMWQIIADGEDCTEVSVIPDTGFEFIEWNDGVLTATRTDRNIIDDAHIWTTCERI